MQAGNSGTAGISSLATSLKKIQSSVNNGTYLIPEFQRKYDWNKSVDRKTKLFDSLFTGVFIGNIVLGVPTFSITCREFDGRPATGKGSRVQLGTPTYSKEHFEQNKHTTYSLILDGQQRVTTIWRALEGHDKLFFNAKEIEELSKDFEEPVEWLSEITTEPIEDQLHIALNKVCEISKLDLEDQIDALESLVKKQEVYTSLPEGSQERKAVKGLFSKMYSVINQFLIDPSVCTQTKIESDLGVFVKYFERANSTPFVLNFVDILVAKIFQDFKLRPSLKSFVNECNQVNYIQDLSEKSTAVFENLVRMVAINSGLQPSKSEMLEKLTAEHFKSHFDLAAKCFQRANQLLCGMDLIHTSSDIPYPNMILPLMIFMSEIHNNDVNNVNTNQKNQLTDWYLRSGFTERYSKKAGEMLNKDINALRKLAKDSLYKLYSDLEYKSSFAGSRLTSTQSMIEFTSRSGGIPRAMFAWDLMTAEGIHNLANGDKIVTGAEVEKHHIFPQNFVDKNGGQDAKDHVHSLMNFVRISKTSNSQISDGNPKQYLSELNNTKLESLLDKHNIPAQVMTYDQADQLLQFLKLRAELIFPLIKDYTTF